MSLRIIIQAVKIDVVFWPVPVKYRAYHNRKRWPHGADIYICRSTHSANSGETNRFFWERYIDNVFSLWNTSLDKIESFVEKENNFHSTIKLTADMSETEIMLLDTKVCKGVTFDKESILDVQTHFYLQTNRNIPVHGLLLV